MRKLLYIPLLLFLYACPSTDDCDEPILESRLDADFRSYFDFKPGTYWIYEDSLTGEQDSVYVISNSKIFNEGEAGRGCDSRYNFEIISISTFNGDTTESFVGTSTFTGNGYQYYRSKMNGTIFFKEKNGDAPFNQTVFKSNFREDLIVNGKSYRNVITIGQPVIDETGYPVDSIYFHWADNVGIIRKDDIDGKISKLKRFSIIK